MIVLNNNQKLILNKTVNAGESITASAIVQTNYITGSNQASISIIGEIDGIIDTVYTEDNNNLQILNIYDTSSILQNVKVELTGGDNQVEASGTIAFTSVLELTFTAVGLGAKGNDVIIEFVAGASRDVAVPYGAETITITFTYIAGDNANNMVEKYDEVSNIILPNGGTIPSNVLVMATPPLGGEIIAYICIMDGYIYATSTSGKLLRFNGINAWEIMCPKLLTYLPTFLVVFRDSLYASCPGQRILKFNGVDAWSAERCM